MPGRIARLRRRRHVLLCYKLTLMVFGLTCVLSYLTGQVYVDESAGLKDIHEYNSENMLYSKDFVIIPSDILRIDWRKRNNSRKPSPSTTTIHLEDLQPKLVLFRPVKRHPSGGVSVLKHRTRLLDYLNKVKNEPKPASIENTNVTLVKQLPMKVLLSKQRPPILTLFTTLKVQEDNGSIEMTTLLLKQWSILKPWVNLILFVDQTDLIMFHKLGLNEQAYTLGWHVMVVPRHVNGLPVVKDMYLTAVNLTEKSTPFVAYANSDIIFELDLIQTLSFLWKSTSVSLIKKGCLFVGKRSPLSMNDYKKKFIKRDKTKALKHEQITKDADYSFDYFITTRNGYKWDKTPDFVVGKPGYDAWLVVMAQEWNLFTIDLTESVTAYHIVVGNNLFPERGWMAKDVCINRQLVDPFDYKRAHTHCAQFFTTINVSNSSIANSIKFELYRRDKLQPVCYLNADPDIREQDRAKYPGCQQTAEIKRSKLKSDMYIEDLIARLDKLIKLHNISEKKNLTDVVV